MRIIGIDYDGTIVDTRGVKAHWLREHMGMEVSPWKTDRAHCVPIIGSENYDRMSEFVYGRQGSLRAKEIRGSIDAIQELAKNSRICIVTARTPRQTRWCKEWLRKKGLDALVHAYFSATGDSADGRELTKPQLCHDHGIRVMIDDDEHHLEGAELANVKRILLKSGCPQPIDVPEGVALARSWRDVLRIVWAELFCHGGD
jgi:FMN phosphatase YigB (HAD superfamily)